MVCSELLIAHCEQLMVLSEVLIASFEQLGRHSHEIFWLSPELRTASPSNRLLSAALCQHRNAAKGKKNQRAGFGGGAEESRRKCQAVR